MRIVFGEPGDERCPHVVVGVGPEADQRLPARVSGW